jgi:hypothetical protein
MFVGNDVEIIDHCFLLLNAEEFTIPAAPVQTVHPDNGVGAYMITTATLFQKEPIRIQFRAMFGLGAERARLMREHSVENHALRQLIVRLETVSRFMPTTAILLSLLRKVLKETLN